MGMVCKNCRIEVTAGGRHFCGVCGECLKVCLGKCEKVGGSRLRVDGGSFVRNTLRRGLGLEVELGEWGMVDRLANNFKWSSTRDGSVYPSEMEMVVWPLRGDAFVDMVLELGRVLKQGRAVVNESCGLHVHVDCLDLGWWGVRRLLKVYEKVEREVYLLCAPERRYDAGLEMREQPHRYCRYLTRALKGMIGEMWKAKSTGEIKKAVLRGLYQIEGGGEEGGRGVGRYYLELKGRKVVDRYGGRLSVVRYQGLNLHSLMHRGTLEWRMKEGTLDAEEILMWGLFCGWFCEGAGRMRDGEVRRVRGLEGCCEKMGMPKMVREWVGRKLREEREAGEV